MQPAAIRHCRRTIVSDSYMNTVQSQQFRKSIGEILVVLHQKHRLGTQLFDRNAIDRVISQWIRNWNGQGEYRAATDSGARGCQRTVLKSCETRGNRQSQPQSAGRSIPSLLMLDERFKEPLRKCTLETNAGLTNRN